MRATERNHTAPRPARTSRPRQRSTEISRLGGYPALFALSGVTTVLGAVLTFRIRSVR